MFDMLQEINSRPSLFEFYTAEELWTDEHTSKKMLEYHLNESIDLSSRNTEFIDDSVEWIVSRFGVGESFSLADFGCGPGLYSTRLAEYGADVTGIDFSRRSIEHAKGVAKKKGLPINYLQCNYLDFDTEHRFDLIIMIFCDFCALSPMQRKSLIAKFHNFLKPGGAVLLDVHTLNIYKEKEEAALYERNQLDGFWSPNEYYGFVNTFKYDDEQVSLDKYTLIERKRTRVVYNWLQYFSRESLSREFEKGGFKVEGFYSDVSGTVFSPDSPDMAVVARKDE
ncbi:MAG: class I SAM-dependent methyltransferase [Desulfocapsaceae bacterium]|nr:class I SAM-dependent methyltransferase [Desulfocapsaceae bacterium]